MERSAAQDVHGGVRVRRPGSVPSGARVGLTVPMHRILLREVVIDAPSEAFPATRDFWAAALLTKARPFENYPEFTDLIAFVV